MTDGEGDCPSVQKAFSNEDFIKKR